MIKLNWTILAVAAIGISAAAAPPPKTAPWSAMDRGPYFTASIQSSFPSKGMTPKGLVIRVSKTASAYVLFDTDLLRYSAAWTGGLIDWHNVAMDGSHQTWASAVGEELFGTRMIPGWAHNGSFADPRTPYPSTQYRPEPVDWQNRAYGPLPHDWAQYKGLYLNGERVVLSYTVSGVPVLDSPGWEENGRAGLFTRTINIAPSTTELIINVAEHSSNEGGIALAGDFAKLALTAAATDSIALLGEPATTVEQGKVRPAAPQEGLLAAWNPNNARMMESRDAKHTAKMSGKFNAVAGSDAVAFTGGSHAQVNDVDGLDLSADFSISAWIKTSAGGTILSKSSNGKWVAGGKTFFVEDGMLGLDIGWVGSVRGKKLVSDDHWHHVSVTHHKADGAVRLYVDGVPDGRGQLKSPADPPASQIRLGLTSSDFPRGNGNQLEGLLGPVQLYGRVLKSEELTAIAGPHEAGEHAFAVAVIGAPAGATWELVEGGRLRLHLPASAEPVKLKILTGRAVAGAEPAFAAAAKASPSAEDLFTLIHGGPPRWPQTITTQAKPGTGDGAYVSDQITGPVDNPWKALMRFGGFDFFADGKHAALCTWDGDVWVVDGLGGSLEKLNWKRIATGLFQPLGLKIVLNVNGEEEIFVCCRDQITRLHDLNGDGEIDFYECFNNDHQVTEHFHEFAMGLQTDTEGNFYYTKGARHALDAVIPQHGTLLKVSKDGSKTEVVCGGFRAANGFGINEAGEMVASDQEGFWTPANRINLLKPGGFYGNMWAYSGRDRKPEQSYDPPLCWLPVKLDRSPAEELWVTSDQWGPMRGRMIHTSYGTGKIFLVLYETVNGVPQGGVVQLPGMTFNTGIMRARFHPTDGQLYVSGMTGWATNCAEPTGFYRIRYTNKPLCLPEALHITKEGVSITFTSPLDRAAAEDVEGYAIKQWQYQWSKRYGSPQYRISDPAKEGQDEVTISGITLSPDQRTVLLKIANPKPVMQMQIQMDIKDSNGKPVKLELHNTINQVPE